MNKNLIYPITKFIIILCLSILIIPNIFLCTNNTQIVWDVYYPGMTQNNLVEQTQILNVNLNDYDIYYPFLRGYFVFQQIYGYDNVCISFDFYEDSLYYINYRLDVYENQVSIYYDIRGKLINKWGYPVLTETYTPESCNESEWDSDINRVLLEGGYKLTQWNVDNELQVELKLYNMNGYINVVEWTVYDINAYNEVQEIKRSMIIDP